MSNYTNNNHPTNRSKRNKSNKQEAKPCNDLWVRPTVVACNKSKTYSNVRQEG